jgi:hypothetical protein
MTVLGLYIFMMMMLIGGLALDVSNAIQARTQLQIAADSAGHAALFWNRFHPDDNPKAKAIEIAQGNMPTSYYGTVLTEDDIVFGTWDADTRTFTPDPSSNTAVWVSTRRLAENQNALSTYLLKIIGLTAFDINTDTVWELYVPGCLKEGIVSQGPINMQSNNTFHSGFCLHSNTGVDLENSNEFMENSVLSVPDRSTIDAPGSDPDADGPTVDGSNKGLLDAINTNYYELNLEQRVQEIWDDVSDPNSELYPDFIVDDVVVELSRNDQINAANIEEGHIYVIDDCVGINQKIRVPAGEVLREAVILTNCKIEFGQGALLEDVIMVTTNLQSNSVDGAEGLIFGKDDSCADGGSTQIVTFGGMNFPAEVSLYGSQLLALGDIQFSSQFNGLEGASIVAGGTVQASTNSQMAFCGDGYPGYSNLDFFRMVL